MEGRGKLTFFERTAYKNVTIRSRSKFLSHQITFKKKENLEKSVSVA